MDSTEQRENWNYKLIYKLPTLESQLMAWIRQVECGAALSNMELRRGGSQLNVRRGRQNLTGMGATTYSLDIVSINLNPKARGRGWFTTFLDIVDAINPWDATYIEAVQNPRLAAYLPRAGFIELPYENFYRPSQRWISRHGWDSDKEAAAKRLIRDTWPKSIIDTLESLHADHAKSCPSFEKFSLLIKEEHDPKQKGQQL